MITPQIDLSQPPATGQRQFQPPPSEQQQQQQQQESNDTQDALATRHEKQDKPRALSASHRPMSLPKLIEKSVIIHKDENGFGLRIKGQSPVYIEHVHEGGAAWRAGVRALDSICKVNGVPVNSMDHKDVVLMFKSCSRFVALTLISPEHLLSAASLVSGANEDVGELGDQAQLIANLINSHHRQYSIYSHHPSEDRRKGPGRTHLGANSNQLDTASMFAPNDYAIDASPALLMDRTRSCRSTGGNLTATLMGQPADQATNSSISSSRNSKLEKLSRSDSNGDETATGKRVAVCTCCQQAACENARLTQGDSSAMLAAHKHLIQRQLNMSLRATPTPTNQQWRASDTTLKPDQGQRQQQQQHQAHSADTSRRNIDKSAAEARRLFGSKIPQSVSSNSLPSAKTGNSGATLPLAGNLKVTPQPPAPLGPKPPRVVNKRIEIIREFIDTERTHTERLRCLDELFYRPLKQAGFMTGEQLRAVFSSHRTLYKIHRQIYRILLSANFDIYSEPLVGSALLEIFEGDLKRRLERAACSFCTAQATNVELLNKLTRRDTKVGEFLAQVTSQRMIGRLGVKDLLASCFQRLTKYPLLLENLLKATPQILPDDDNDEGERHDEIYARLASDVRGTRLLCPLAPALGTSGSNRGKLGRRHFSSGAGKHSISDNESELNIDHHHGDDDDDNYDDDGVDDDDELEDPQVGNLNDRRLDCDDDDDDEDDDGDGDDEETRRLRLGAAEEARRNSRRMLAISLAEEREFIERALVQSRQILVRVNDSIRVAMSRNKLKEIWKRTDKYPGVPLIDITKQQVVHEGLLTLRLSKRSFDVYVLLLNDYIIILTREGQDKYRLKFFTPEGKSAAGAAVAAMSVASGSGGGGGGGSASSNQLMGNQLLAGPGGSSASCGANQQSAPGGGGGGASMNLTAPHQTVYSPVFVIDEHLTTRDAATDENGFYLLCKRKDDSRIYEFASRSPAERMKWRDKIQWTIERQMSRNNRRPSCNSTLTKSSSEISANGLAGVGSSSGADKAKSEATNSKRGASLDATKDDDLNRTADNRAAPTRPDDPPPAAHQSRSSSRAGAEPTKIVGTISYVIDDGIIMPHKMESSRVFVDQAIQVNILDGGKVSAARVQESSTN